MKDIALIAFVLATFGLGICVGTLYGYYRGVGETERRWSDAVERGRARNT